MWFLTEIATCRPWLKDGKFYHQSKVLAYGPEENWDEMTGWRAYRRNPFDENGDRGYDVDQRPVCAPLSLHSRLLDKETCLSGDKNLTLPPPSSRLLWSVLSFAPPFHLSSFQADDCYAKGGDDCFRSIFDPETGFLPA
eukprot:744292-Rhodomonas_salina.1